MAVIPPVVAGTPTSAGVTGAASGLTIAKPSGVQTGDILVAVLRTNSSTTTTDWALAGWTRRGPTFAASSASARVTSVMTHYVSNAGSEPSSYAFTVGVNGTRLSGLMFIVRPGIGAQPWGAEPTYGASTTWTGAGPITISTFSCTANSLVIYAGANETTSPSTTTWTPPSGSTSIGIQGSVVPDSTAVTRSVAAAAYEVIAGTSVASKTVTFPVYSSTVGVGLSIPGTNPATPIGLPVKNGNGDTVYLSYLDGSSTRVAPASVSIWLPGFPDVTSFLAKAGATAAHRGGSLNFPSFSEYAYDRSVRAGWGALEFSCGWPSDNIPFGLSSQYLDPTALNNPAGTTLPVASYTWATIAATWQNIAGPGATRPYFKLEDFLRKYTPTHVCLVDPKFGFSSATQVGLMLDICDAYGGPSKIIIKFDSPTTNTNLQTLAHARGYQCMNYWGSDTASMATQQSTWDIIGALYSDSAAMAQANTYGKPSWAAVVPNQAGYATSIANGADFVMCSDVLNIVPVSVR